MTENFDICDRLDLLPRSNLWVTGIVAGCANLA